MIKFRGGPADGSSLMLRRAPFFLRVVTTPTGDLDALDQLKDRPEFNETCHVYELAEHEGRYHIRTARGSATPSGFYERATYAYRADQPDQSLLKNQDQWEHWCNETYRNEVDDGEADSKGNQGPTRPAAGGAGD